MEKKENWGGLRKAGPGKKIGRPPLPLDEKRVQGPRLSPETKYWIEIIVQRMGYKSVGYVLDQAVAEFVKRLGIK